MAAWRVVLQKFVPLIRPSAQEVQEHVSGLRARLDETCEEMRSHAETIHSRIDSVFDEARSKRGVGDEEVKRLENVAVAYKRFKLVWNARPNADFSKFLDAFRDMHDLAGGRVPTQPLVGASLDPGKAAFRGAVEKYADAKARADRLRVEIDAYSARLHTLAGGHALRKKSARPVRA
ncbi:MAG: hypothetical protein JW834_04075 [Candidatus Diapherotrites archaeon]|nr:hypothetical protein [Candidatus Diapherotrites archaeon]